MEMKLQFYWRIGANFGNKRCISFAYCNRIILNNYGVTLCVYKVAPFFARK